MTGEMRSCASVPPDGRTKLRPSRCRWGYTLVELMATITIVAVLAATVGMFFARLLSLQEREREEAYIRERLAEVCGVLADDLSVAASFGTRIRPVEQDIIVAYREETGGVSLETGRVSRVAQLVLTTSATNRAAALNVYVNTRLMKDRAAAEEMNGKIRAMLEKFVPEANKIYESVVEQLMG